MSPKRIPRRVWRSLGRFWVWIESPKGGAIMQILAAVGLLTLGVVFYLYSAQTHDALCHFRDDIEQRYERSKLFLDGHPELKQIKFGSVVVTRAEMLSNLSIQKATLRSLDSLHC